jgi:hypothetical protein
MQALGYMAHPSVHERLTDPGMAIADAGEDTHVLQLIQLFGELRRDGLDVRSPVVEPTGLVAPCRTAPTWAFAFVEYHHLVP